MSRVCIIQVGNWQVTRYPIVDHDYRNPGRRLVESQNHASSFAYIHTREHRVVHWGEIR
jgi:hypothetical protein